MAAARYWRLLGIEAAGGGDLELSEVALYAGASRIDGSATLTCSHAPLTGSLADLKDGSTSTACRFAAADVGSAGFYLQWDFGSAVDIAEIKLGSASSAARFLSAATLMQSANPGVWAYAAAFSGAIYPGVSTLSTSSAGGLAPTTWNPSDKGSGAVLSGGNLSGYFPGGTSGSVRSVFGASSGKWYWEITGSSYLEAGIATSAMPLMAYPDSSPYAFVLFFNNGDAWNNNAGKSYASAVGADVVSVLLDLDARTLSYWLGGVPKGVAYSLPSDTYYAFAGSGASVAATCTANFGASAFAHSPPAGYSAGFGPAAFKLPETAPPAPRTVGSSLLTAAASSVHDFSLRNVGRIVAARDTGFGGTGTIYGTTKTRGTPNQPAKARVVLLHQRSKLPVRETWSDPVTGNFAFTGIDTTQQFLTLAEDAAGNFRPVAANRLTPEVLP